jgi:hypothetical protein
MMLQLLHSAALFNEKLFDQERILRSPNLAGGQNPHHQQQHAQGQGQEIQQHAWTYKQLPFSGAQSVVHVGPSPTACLAAMQVWLDHPDSRSLRCLTPESVNALSLLDRGQGKPSVFDWHQYWLGTMIDGTYIANRLCLRYSTPPAVAASSSSFR